MPPIRPSSLAPRVFIRILRQIAAKVRSEGIRTLTVIYLDVPLLIHHSEGYIKRDLSLCADTFVQPGFHSETREMLSGTNQSLSLSGHGARHNLHVSCPARGTGNRIHGRCQEMLESHSTSLGKLVTLWGPMSHAARTGLWIASLCNRALWRQQALLLHRFGWRPRCQMFEELHLPVRQVPSLRGNIDS